MPKLIHSKQFENVCFKVFDDKPDCDFYELNQVHGKEILYASPELLKDEFCQADGLITKRAQSSLPICIKTADCLPLLFIGQNEVALLHAGWRGVHQKIHLHALIKKMNPYLCYIGPHILQDSFEVTEEFKDHFKSDEEFFKSVNSRLFFSLEGLVEKDLKKNFPRLTIESSGIDTFTNDQFNSFRRNKTKTRNYNLVFIH